ncbi:MAG TPA: hypothetical protein VFV71_04850 [Burkholderiales bacterium]|nr:hypothetical protein [Burkholderiales bacterium]
MAAPGAHAAPGDVRSALDGGRLGLYDARDFRVAEGACADCGTIPQALWYFRDDVVAVPAEKPSGFARERTAQDDVRGWLHAFPDGDGSRPPLIWIGSPQIVDAGRLPRDVAASPVAGRFGYALAPKIAANLSYFDASSARHFDGRALKMRGRTQDGLFVARTLWPLDYALDFRQPALRPLGSQESLVSLVRADGGGAREPFAARVLWRRDAGAAPGWAGRPVLAFMLNGAQGDDDEAHGGHFAVVTGAFGPSGEWGDWLVDNFYNLDAVSEKGIIASTLPMDAYLADLNSGQAWYRPSYLLVAVLKRERTAALYQQAIGRVYNHFYRHDFLYRHSIANCAGISMQTLRSLGWAIPRQGPTSFAKAAVALPFMAAKDASLASGQQAFDYLAAERTDLYPFAAFDAIGRDLLGRVAAGLQGGSRFERMLAEDLDAVVFLRIPQFPSSRAFGQAPVLSMDDYLARVPADKSEWKIIPVAPRPFPEELRDRGVPADRTLPSVYATWAWGAFIVLAAAAVVCLLRRRWRTARD